MLWLLRATFSLILLTALGSRAALANAEFDQAYKAAQAGNYKQGDNALATIGRAREQCCAIRIGLDV